MTTQQICNKAIELNPENRKKILPTYENWCNGLAVYGEPYAFHHSKDVFDGKIACYANWQDFDDFNEYALILEKSKQLIMEQAQKQFEVWRDNLLSIEFIVAKVEIDRYLEEIEFCQFIIEKPIDDNTFCELKPFGLYANIRYGDFAFPKEMFLQIRENVRKLSENNFPIINNPTLPIGSNYNHESDLFVTTIEYCKRLHWLLRQEMPDTDSPLPPTDTKAQVLTEPKADKKSGQKKRTKI